MLCLNCGKDIGDKIGYCENCTPEVSDLSQADEAADAVEELGESGSEPEAELEAEELQASTEDSAPVASEEPSKKRERRERSAGDGQDSRRRYAIIGALGICVVVLLMLGVFGSEEPSPSSDGTDSTESTSVVEQTSEGSDEDESQEVADTQAAVSQIDETETETPTQPYIVAGTIIMNGRRTSFADAIFVYYPFESRAELGLYRQTLELEQKAELASMTSLGNAPTELLPDAIISLLLNPQSAICSGSEIQHVSLKLRASEGGFSRDATITLASETGGISAFSCALSAGSPFTLEFAQTLSQELDGNAVEFQWDLSVSGPIFESTKLSELNFDSSGYWSLGLWDKDERNVTVGFFRNRLNSDERKIIREAKSLTALNEKIPDVVLSFEILEGATEFRRENLRSFGVQFLRRPKRDLRSYSFPGEEPVVQFYSIVSSEASPALDQVSGDLFEAEMVSANLAGSEVKELDGRKGRFSWNIKFSAPIIDVLSQPISSVVFDPELATIDRSVPTKNEAVIEVGKSSLKLVDALAFYYPAESNLVIGMYAAPLTAEDKASIIAEKSVWQAARAQSPNLVVILDLAKGSTSVMRTALESLRLTFVRDRMGAFFFPGSFDRATVKRIAAELNDSQMSHISGLAEENGSVALRLQGTHVSDKSKLTFSWNIAILTQVVVVRD